MATYVKVKCGNCGKILEKWHQDTWHKTTRIGNPFTKCQNCGHINIDTHAKEYNMLKKWDYVSMLYPTVCGSVGIAIIVFFFTGLLLSLLEISDDKVSTIAIGLALIILIVSAFFGIKNEIILINKNIEKSKERLKDPNYNEAIKKLIKDMED